MKADKEEVLASKKKRLLAMLSFLEESHEEGSISEDSYEELLNETLNKLEDVEKQIRSLKSSENVTASKEFSEVSLKKSSFSENLRKISDRLKKNYSRDDEKKVSEDSSREEDIRLLLSSLEESYRSGEISESNYLELKRKNEMKLREILSSKNERKSVGFGESSEENESSFSDEVVSEEVEEGLEEDSDLKKEPVVVKKKFSDPAGDFSGETPPVPKVLSSKPKKENSANNPAGDFTGDDLPDPSSFSVSSSDSVEKPKKGFFSKLKLGFNKGNKPAFVSEESVDEENESSKERGFGNQLDKLALDVEKINTKLESFSEMRNVMEERIEHIMENIGELRTMLFEKESESKETSAKVDRIKDLVEEIDPQKYVRELGKRDKLIEDLSMRIERMEAVSKDLSDTLSSVRNMLEGIGSLKNVVEVSKEISDKAARIDKIISRGEKISEDVGRIYIDLNKRMGDFSLYKSRQEMIEESVKELVTLIDGVSSKLDGFVSRDEYVELKSSIDELSKDVEELKAKSFDIPIEVSEELKEKESVEALISSIEEEFKKGIISREEYEKAIKANEDRLKSIKAHINEEIRAVKNNSSVDGASSTVVSEFNSGTSISPPSLDRVSVESGSQSVDGNLVNEKNSVLENSSNQLLSQPLKRGRGRPRKNPLPFISEEKSSFVSTEVGSSVEDMSRDQKELKNSFSKKVITIGTGTISGKKFFEEASRKHEPNSYKKGVSEKKFKKKK